MKKTIDLKINNWDKITISIYNKINEITNSDDDEMTRNVRILALLCGVDEDVVWGLSLPEVNRLTGKAKWLGDTMKYPKGKIYNHVTLNGRKYDVNTDLQKFSIAQYMDFQTWWGKHDIPQYLSRILSTFIIPEGHKYNEGYDIEETIRDIEEGLPITDANAICFFFARRLVSSIGAIKTCLTWMMKKMLKRMGNRETAANLAARIKEMETLSLGWL